MLLNDFSVFLFAVVYSAVFFMFFFVFLFVLYLFSNFITVLGLFKFYPLSVAELSLCINDCVTCLYQFPDPAKVSDPDEDYILSLHQHFSIHQTAYVSKPSSWSTCCPWSSVQHPGQSHPVTLSMTVVALVVAVRPVPSSFSSTIF